MHTYNAYAAKTAKGPLEPFSFVPGELGPEEVEINVTHCGICRSDLSMLDNDWGMSNYPFVPGHEVVGTKALQLANKWGGEDQAFTTSDNKEGEARALGAHFVHNTNRPDALKKLARSLDIIISTINAPLDVPALLDTLKPKGHLHNVG